MPRINQFQPCLYALVLLGMVGYALASGSPLMWVLGSGGVLLNWWLVATKRFKPLPRLVANVLTVGTMLYVGRDLTTAGSSAVLVIGRFLVVLQLVKLWEQRANRDYGQLLVLSLLLMVAAAINTSHLLFGLLFGAYLLLSLYCCLLFHLKVETDAARAACAAPEEKVNPATLRQDEHHLSRSMRRITGLMAGFSLAMAVFVFLMFPRSVGQAMLVPAPFRPQDALTGFTDEVRFDQVARITQNDSVIAYAQVWRRAGNEAEKLLEDGRVLLLRGVTLDTYHPNGSKGDWKRNAYDQTTDVHNSDLPWGSSDPPPLSPEVWRQKISLHPTGTRVLFALPGPFSLTPHRDIRLRRGSDGAIQSDDPITTETDYEVLSTNQLDDSPMVRVSDRPLIDPAVAAYAARPDVSGSDADGSLAGRRRQWARDNADAVSDLDERIAQNIESHLRGPGFSYTLDITDARTRRDMDPYVWFLSPDGHRGHCEYFAGAMVLMCQSLGMEARMVVGFKCDEFNNTPGAGYYIVRQSQAHAWVEVRTAGGWMSFDPTSGRDDRNGRSTGTLSRWWKGVRHFFDFLEYTYAEKVVAYDNENRQNLLDAVENRMMATAITNTTRLHRLQRRWDHWWDTSSLTDALSGLGGPLLGTLLAVAGLIAAFFASRWAWRRVQLRRRAARIGIESLPPAEQLRLARQLGFYDDLLQLLGRHRIHRPAHLTPMEFSGALSYLPGDVYQAVRRLTAVYYRVRYGRADLSPGQQARLGNMVGRLEAGLGHAAVENR